MASTGFEQLSRAGAAAVAAAFVSFESSFSAITRRARERFARRDWGGLHADASERLDLYSRTVAALVSEVRGFLGAASEDRRVWQLMKPRYSAAIAGRDDLEIAETFFNSLTRKIFSTAGVDPTVEFVDSDFEIPAHRHATEVWSSYPWSGKGAAALIGAILADRDLGAPLADPTGDAALAGAILEAQLRAAGMAWEPCTADVLAPVFYRGTTALLVGRLRFRDRTLPLLLALAHGEAGVEVDAVLTNPDEASIVFSFARSYFHVESEQPHEIVGFLRTLMPRKPVADLYISIGHHKHGKTEMYRELLRHLQSTPERFEVAPGEQGLVMLVFTLPSFDTVFKVIRDFAGAPKRTTRGDVLDRYHLVFRLDRVGRLVDAQEFEHLTFARDRFSGPLLELLAAHAGNSVVLDGDRVTIKHLFTERRVVPFNLYIKEMGGEAADAATVDLGQAIKDLAAANIFPGDLLPKNFGVTRHGRVVFYDYDELCLLEQCVFRALPPSRDIDDEMSDQPWFYVGENDVFPEEFSHFLGLPPRLRDVFLAHHPELFDPAYWRGLQARHRAGEVIDVRSWREERRLRPGS